MKIEKLERRTGSDQNKRLTKAYDAISNLIEALNNKDLPEDIAKSINSDIYNINFYKESNRDLLKLLNKTNKQIIELIEKKLGLVKKNHYQNSWMAYGMLIGVVFTSIAQNFIEDATWSSPAMGISMGLIFGLLAGKNRDKKAEKDGLQLDF